MTDLFTPRRADGIAEWRVVYNHTIELPYGTPVTFTDLAAWLEDGSRDRAYRAVARCNRQFGREGLARILGSNRPAGYRVLRPEDYAPLALNYQQQARRRISRAVIVLECAPVADMSQAHRDWAHKVTMILRDNELRLRSQEAWRQEAEARLTALERKIAEREAGEEVRTQ